MGHSQTSTASLGIKILLSELIQQINKKNFKHMMELLHSGIIEDENEYYNEKYSELIYNDKLTEDYKDSKKFMIEFCKNDSNKLWDKYLLIPLKEILYTTRWGYNREGTHASSRPIDFDLSVNIKGIENFQYVFILAQN